MIAPHEAHVAVRTIYVKFGGKSGLFQAVLIANRDRFITPNQMEVDQRPFKEVIDEFGEHFFDMITAPEALAVQRMVIAETKTNPEVGTSFFEAGPRQTREMLGRFFARPEVRAQMRDDVDLDLLPSFLIQCVMGDPFSRFLFDPALQPRDEMLRLLNKRMALFYRSVLLQP
ncbi:TetR/AcrR family transcriptional regulator C-terminal domain-containing protein [Massilia sp. B-10]|nr:TetR/AcrR family transcriptional regulator C-terminal domain-containing protein [Massilia sp. B-10]